MNDLSRTIAPKSDQLNADDLITGPRTITVTKVSLMTEPDQPVAIGFEGDGGKPYKPCKSMRRVMITLWGHDGNVFIGRRMTLYRDDKVMFGGDPVGGIRISHMSDIDEPRTIPLTVTRAKRKPYLVKPLPRAEKEKEKPPAEEGFARAPARAAADPALLDTARAKAREGYDPFNAWFLKLPKDDRPRVLTIEPELRGLIDEADKVGGL